MIASSPEIHNFFSAIKDDSRINAIHISLFMAIVQRWYNNNCKSPVCVFSKDLMHLAKISGIATYCKGIHELADYGYIRYEPSFNNHKGSLIFINE